MAQATATPTTTTSKIDRAAVMRRAWEIFRETYHYPRVSFRSIGRGCFAWALKRAWWEAREKARIAAIPAEVKANRIAVIREQIDLLGYQSFQVNITPQRQRLEAELAQLAS